MNLRTIITIVIIFILVILIRNTVVSIYSLIENEGTVQDLQNNLKKEKQRHAFLQQKLSEVKSDSFVEREARSKLGLVRENEYPVFVSPPLPTPDSQKSQQYPNWKKWKQVFRL